MIRMYLIYARVDLARRRRNLVRTFAQACRRGNPRRASGPRACHGDTGSSIGSRRLREPEDERFERKSSQHLLISPRGVAASMA